MKRDEVKPVVAEIIDVLAQNKISYVQVDKILAEVQRTIQTQIAQTDVKYIK